MSSSDPRATARVAEWRRQGSGIWTIIMIAEGYDDQYTMMYPGALSERKVKKRARNECAAMIGCHAKHVHLKSIVKEG